MMIRFCFKLNAMNRTKNFDFVQLNLSSFLNDLIRLANETIHLFSKFLANDAKTGLFEMRDKLEVRRRLVFLFYSNFPLIFVSFFKEYGKNLKQPTDTLEDLKFVLRTIAEIQSQSDVIEARINEIHDKYNLLESYHQKVKFHESIFDNFQCFFFH